MCLHFFFYICIKIGLLFGLFIAGNISLFYKIVFCIQLVSEDKEHKILAIKFTVKKQPTEKWLRNGYERGAGGDQPQCGEYMPAS